MSARRDEEMAATRREFLRVAAVGAAGLLIGCGGEKAPGSPGVDGGVPVAEGGAAGADSGADAGSVGPPDAGQPIDATLECIETEDNDIGPFYSPGAPEKSDLAEPGMPGTRLTVSGRVLDRMCAPLARATLDIWQCDDDGRYDRVGYVLRGKVRTDSQGRYEFRTIVPGHYLNGDQYRPAHIHVTVSARGYPPLTTQLYFKGDRYNAIDPFIKESLIMVPMVSVDGSERATFDFVVTRR